MSFGDVQQYVERRGREPGRRGRSVSAATIKKEVVTLASIWQWAVRMKYVDGPLPKHGLRYPKTAEKPPFQTRKEIEHQIEVTNLASDQIADLWDCLFLTVADVEDVLADIKKYSTFDFVHPMACFAAYTGADVAKCSGPRPWTSTFELQSLSFEKRNGFAGRTQRGGYRFRSH